MYGRVSTHNQSIDSQKSAIYSYANKNKIRIDEEILCEAVSAKMDEDKRKITDLKKTLQPFDTCIVSSLDRLGRSIHQIVNLMTWFTENQINLIVVDNDSIRIRAGTDDLTTKLITTIFGLLAEVEHQVLTDRIQSGVKLAQERGVKFGRKKGQFVKSRLDGKEEVIRSALRSGVPKTRVAKDMNISTTALNNWLKRRKVMEKAPEKNEEKSQPKKKTRMLMTEKKGD